MGSLRRTTPDAGVVEWFSRRSASTLFLSVLTLGELRKGIDAVTTAEPRLSLPLYCRASMGKYCPGYWPF